MEMSNTEQLASQLKALGDVLHLRILETLRKNNMTNSESLDLRLDVKDLAAELDLPQPTLSHHLKRLREAGFLDARRKHSNIYYLVDVGAIERCLDAARTYALPCSSP